MNIKITSVLGTIIELENATVEEVEKILAAVEDLNGNREVPVEKTAPLDIAPFLPRTDINWPFHRIKIGSPAPNPNEPRIPSMPVFPDWPVHSPVYVWCVDKGNP